MASSSSITQAGIHDWLQSVSSDKPILYETEISQLANLLRNDSVILDVEDLILITEIVCRYPYNLVPDHDTFRTFTQRGGQYYGSWINVDQQTDPVDGQGTIITVSLTRLLNQIITRESKIQEPVNPILYARLLNAFRNSYPIVLSEWTKDEFMLLSRFMSTVVLLKDNELIERSLRYFQDILTNRYSYDKHQFSNERPRIFMDETIALGYNALGYNALIVSEQIKQTNILVSKNESYYAYMLVQQAEEQGIDPNLPIDWLAGILNNPVAISEPTV